jgi:hypothetical protein
MPETHGQLVHSRRPGQELVILDEAGGEIARVHVASGRCRLAITPRAGVRVVRGEIAERWRPRPADSKWDLVGVDEAAAIAGETVAGFLAAVQRKELPEPRRRWREDGSGGWKGDPRWRRGELLAAVANRDGSRRRRLQEPAGGPPAT